MTRMLCLHGVKTRGRCRKTATWRVIWSTDDLIRRGDDRCDQHEPELSARLESDPSVRYVLTKPLPGVRA